MSNSEYITSKSISDFEKAIRDFDWFSPLARGIDPIIVDAQYRALKSQLETLRK